MAREANSAWRIRGAVLALVGLLVTMGIAVSSQAQAMPVCSGDNPPPVCDGGDPGDPGDPPPAANPLPAPTLVRLAPGRVDAKLVWNTNTTFEVGYVIEHVGHGRTWTVLTPGHPGQVTYFPSPIETSAADYYGFCLDVWAFSSSGRTSSKVRWCSAMVPPGRDFDY